MDNKPHREMCEISSKLVYMLSFCIIYHKQGQLTMMSGRESGREIAIEKRSATLPLPQVAFILHPILSPVQQRMYCHNPIRPFRLWFRLPLSLSNYLSIRRDTATDVFNSIAEPTNPLVLPWTSGKTTTRRDVTKSERNSQVANLLGI